MMHIIKVDAINSTNSFMRDLFKENPGMTPTCVLAERQLQGRGQRGTSWISKSGQNLTFSVFWPKPKVPVQNNFLLSATVSTAIIKSLRTYGIPQLKVKWPNDIMSENQKIAGILIENVIADTELAASVIGIGLNVNQTDFEALPAAGSLKLATGQHFNLEELLSGLLTALEGGLKDLGKNSSEEIMQAYKNELFKINKPATFQLPNHTRFTGMIENVALNGKLLVRNEDHLLKEFDLKEIKLCY